MKADTEDELVKMQDEHKATVKELMATEECLRGARKNTSLHSTVVFLHPISHVKTKNLWQLSSGQELTLLILWCMSAGFFQVSVLPVSSAQFSAFISHARSELLLLEQFMVNMAKNCCE